MGRSRSRSPGYRDEYRGGRGDYRRQDREPPTRTSVLLRNVAHTATQDDIRYHAGKYGSIKDVYLPKDYYTKKLKGIAFIEYTTSRDADDAVRGLDGLSICGREVQATYAKQGRKRPEDFRRMGIPPPDNYGGGYGGDYRGGGGGGRRGRSYSRSRSRSRDRYRRRSPSRDRSRSRDRRRSPSRDRSRSRDRSPRRDRSGSPRRDDSPRRSPKPADSLGDGDTAYAPE